MYKKYLLIVLASLAASVISYSAMFVLPSVHHTGDQQVLSERHQELLNKNTLTFEEVGELNEIVDQLISDRLTGSSKKDILTILRMRALMIGWLPWLFLGYAVRMRYKDLLYIAPFPITFWALNLYVGIETVAYITAAGLGIFLKQKLKDGIKA